MISIQFNSFHALMGRAPWVQWLYSPHRLDRVPIWLWKSSSGIGNQTTHRRTSVHEVLRQKTHKQELEYWLFLLRCFSDPCRYRRYLYYQGKKYHIKSAPPALPFDTPVTGMSQIPSSIRFERHAWESAVSQTMIWLLIVHISAIIELGSSQF